MDIPSDPTNTSDLPSPGENGSHSQLASLNKDDNILLQSNSSDMEVQLIPAGAECPLSRDENISPINDIIQTNGIASNDTNPINNDNVHIDMNNEKSNTTRMIQKLSEREIQYQLEHFTVANDFKGKFAHGIDLLFKFLKLDTPPLSHKEKNIDVQGFLSVFPYGIGGQNSDRIFLQPKMYEKTRVLSGRNHIRRNISYLFHLLNVSEKRAINQGVFLAMKNVKYLDGKNVGELKKMILNDDKTIERNLNRAVSKIPNSPSYWNAPKSMLKCLSETYGPATFFITFSPAEYDWPDLHNYLKNHNSDLNMPARSLVTVDPVLTTIFIHTKFNSLHAFILESFCLGQVEHWFFRVEYQSRGTPHFHCLYWIKDAPITGQSSDEVVMKFVNDHITCKFPTKSDNSGLYELVNNYLQHKCGNYCTRRIKTKTGFKRSCRFGFPRMVTSKMILNDVVEAIIGRKTSGFKKRLYHLPRTENEKSINDYNQTLLELWRGNMDIQFIGEISYALEQYITKYITKSDKSHLTNDDFGFNNSIISQIWQGIYRFLRTREMGVPEVVARWLLDELYQCSEGFQFISTVFLKNRARTMKSYTDLEKEKEESTDIFHRDLLSTFYPERPKNLEKMSLKDYASNYIRGYPTKNKPDTDADKQTEGQPSSCKNKSLIKLNGNNGYMRKRQKEVLIFHHEFDPQVDPESYYYSLLLLFKPWRKEEELKGNYKSYQEAFELGLKYLPLMKEYNDLKNKIDKSKQKINDKVKKKIQKMGEEELESETDEDESNDATALDQVMNDFEEINNVGDISTEEQLSALVETLNPEQREIYDKITNAIAHSIDHAFETCKCPSYKPLYLYVSGFGGTGKSYLIKAIMAWAYITSNVLKKNCKIILAAPTGISAAGINGMTLHSALSLPIEHHGKVTYNSLTGAKLQQLQYLMKHVHCLMVDEISMVSNLTLLQVHLRLSDIFGCQYRNRNWFGSQNVIVFGDLLQLPPVKGDEVFIDLSEKQVKEATGMMSTNLSLFSHFEYAELTINQRQKNDINAHFKDCLTRIRIGMVSDSDIDLLKSRCINVCRDNPLQSLVDFYNNLAKDGEFPVCLLPTKSMVREFNDAILLSRSSNKIEDIQAIDDLQCNFRQMRAKAQEKFKKMDMDDRETAGLESHLRVSVGTRVMLRRNRSTAKKLVNGSTGTITNFKHNHNGQVNQIVIKFDGIDEPVEIERDTSKIRIFEHAYLYRQQFPLTCAYAITIHKSQGLSLKCVMADLGDSIFSEGQIYVALSRVQTLSGLHLININFNKIKASPKALEYYARKSSQIYKTRKNKNIEKTEVTWYTLSKKRKQTELIKHVIDKEIENVPATIYSKKKKDYT